MTILRKSISEYNVTRPATVLRSIFACIDKLGIITYIKLSQDCSKLMLKKKANTNTVSKKGILVTVGSGYGNIVWTTPMIRYLSKVGYEVDVYLNSPYEDSHQLLKPNKCVREVIPYVPGIEINDNSYDLIFRTFWGVATGCKNEVEPLVNDFNSLLSSGLHEVEIHLAQVEKEFSGLVFPIPHPFVSDIKWEYPGEGLLIVNHKSENKFWERRRYPWMETLFNLLRELNIDNGGIRYFPGDYRNIRAACKALSKASMVIGHDCGPIHLASAMGVPTVGLFAPTSTIKARPWGRNACFLVGNMTCQPCHGTKAWENCTDWVCMRSIKPQRIVDAVISLRNKVVMAH